MKNLINFKSILIPSLGLAGLLLFATSCSENKTTDSMEVAEQENISKLTNDDRTAVVIDNDNDAQFLMDAAEMQMEEISLGKLAQQKGNSPHVKELGKMMEEDHSKSLSELKALAQSKSVSIPASVTEDSRDAYKSLNEETGNDFGKAYTDMMVEHHEDAIELYEKAATDSEDPKIRAYATEKLPGLRTHLQHAEAAKEKSDNIKS
ncbi:DUF4142 domain-containing protein [Aquiflexum sp.]|uniref:DUF4142 domain-containing protein n=1 Tax=Aquiflexum sp. TaxID=1872584 RepID=UPI003593F81F